MKNLFKIFVVLSVFVLAASCKENDDFSESIFDTTITSVDKDATTAPFDQWLYDTFVVPYNTEIQYKFNYPASSLEFQLAAADYKKSQMLARFIKYLFYDVYNKYGEKDANGNELFMKLYGPRIFHFIGSDAFSPTTGTETLGYASAGVKITLIGVNKLRTVEPGMSFTQADIDELNYYQFHTMHHEFSHILHQTKYYPTAYALVTAGSYDPRNWQERDSTQAHALGFVTHYSCKDSYEDFVELLSCTITDSDNRWMNTIIDLCLNGGVKTGDKEQVMALIDSLEIQNFDDPKQHWNRFTIYTESAMSEETGNYEPTGRYVMDDHLADATGHSEVKLRFTEFKKFTSFQEFLDWVDYDTSDNNGGMNAVLKKYELATKWYTETWGLHLFTMRREVRERQNNLNKFINSDQFAIFDYQ